MIGSGWSLAVLLHLIMCLLWNSTAIRKLTKKMENVEGKLEKRDILQDYSNYASQTYAPLSRTGYSLDRLSAQYAVKSPFLDSYQGETSSVTDTYRE